MKIFSKTIAVVMSAFMILTCFVPAVSAVQTAPRTQIRVIRCDGSDCSSEEMIEKLCKNCGFCLADLLKSIKNCSRGNSCPAVPVPTEPVIKVDEPVKPAEPIIVPTEPVIEVDEPVKPTEPVIVPTESAVTPAEPVTAPTEPVAETVEPTVPVQQESKVFNTEYEAQVLRLVNAERARYGLAALRMDEGAVKAARLRATEIVRRFSHTRPDGSSCFSAAAEYGVSFRMAGENIAYGYRTPEQVVRGWMNSEGHRKNILSPSFSAIGIGCYESSGILYWSQFFIG